jgi:2-oxo-3-hexenedioate decarboxylase
MRSPESVGPIEDIGREALAVLGTGRQIAPFSQRYAGFDLRQAYEVAENVRAAREQRGERAVGRKIGFTNRAVWAGFGISAPIWNYMFDTTVRDLDGAGTFALANTTAPRIEPEIVLHLATAPRAGMTESELTGCIDWVAHGFEIVDSIFPGWTFAAADAVAGFGVHTALLIGPRRMIKDDRAQWAANLATFGVTLSCSDGTTRSGNGANVLGSPLTALKFLIDELARSPFCPPLAAGEIITTGTLTDAMPIAAGQSWSTTVSGIALDGLRLQVC